MVSALMACAAILTRIDLSHPLALTSGSLEAVRGPGHRQPGHPVPGAFAGYGYGISAYLSNT